MSKTVCQALAWVFAFSCLVRADATTQPGAAQRIPTHVFAGEKRGPFRTGTFEELWIDDKRDELTTKEPADKRHLMVQVWYPADIKGEPQTAPYTQHREPYPRDDDASWLDAVSHVRTTSVVRAPLAATSTRKLPVLLYNPGGGHPQFSATFQTEFLASHGYVVVAVGHTGTTRIERFPNGYVYTPDPEHDLSKRAVEAGWSALDSFREGIKHRSDQQMPREVRDLSFVLDRLQTMHDTPGSFFHQRLDLGRVGSLGWSIGGALSLQASRDEPRIKAAANLDGWLYTDVADTGVKRPVLLMHSDQEPGRPEQQEVFALSAARFWQMLRKTNADWYDLRLARASHGHFSDRSLFEPVSPEMMHPRLAHEIINGFVLEFFDKYLQGRKDTPLLSGKQVYPEVQILKKVSAAKAK